MTTFRRLLLAALFLPMWALTGCQRSAERAVSPTSTPDCSASPAEIPAATDSPSLREALTAAASPTASAGGEAGHTFEIRGQDGKAIVTDRQIMMYDWKTHRITLEPGTKVEPPPKEGNVLVSGIPFAVAADGDVCYAGVFTTSFSSISQSVPVINLHPLEKDEGAIRIELGYPTEEFFRGGDPRSDPRIRKALASLGKLKE